MIGQIPSTEARAYSTCSLSNRRIRPGDLITNYNGNWVRLDAAEGRERELAEAAKFRDQFLSFIGRLPERAA